MKLAAAVMVMLAALIVATMGTPAAYLVAGLVFILTPAIAFGIEVRQAGREIDAHVEFLTTSITQPESDVK